MPHPTFDRLPPEKRARFVRAARDEFASQPFALASIRRIVATLGIAKGSVYQYFDDKADLFCWLVDEAGRRKVAAIEAGLGLDAGAIESGRCWAAGPGGAGGSDGAAAPPDVFGRLRAQMVAGLVFAAREPAWARILWRAQATPVPGLAAVQAAQAQAARAHLAGMLAAGVAEGSVRAGLAPALVVPLVQGLLGEGLLAASLARAGAADPLDPAVGGLTVADAQEVVDTALALLRRGLAP